MGYLLIKCSTGTYTVLYADNLLALPIDKTCFTFLPSVKFVKRRQHVQNRLDLFFNINVCLNKCHLPDNSILGR